MDDLLLISEVFRFPHKRYYWQMRFFRPRIYLLNWQKKRLLKKIVAPPAYFDKEEFKFLRLSYHYSGARGITSNSKYIFISLQNAILVYDIGLEKQVARIDHKLLNGIHEISWHKDRLYVTCAVTDSILVMSEDGQLLDEFHLGSNSYFLERFNLPPRQLDNRLDYRIMHRTKRLYHVNNVQVIGKDIYANFNRQGSFVRVYPEEEIIIQDEALKESHNAQFSPNKKHILINDTRNYALRVFDLSGSQLNIIDLRKFPLPVKFSEKKTFGHSHRYIKAGWLRGLAFSKENDEIVYLGLSPAMIVAVNYLSSELIDYFPFRKNIWISVHGLHNLSRRNDLQ